MYTISYNETYYSGGFIRLGAKVNINVAKSRVSSRMMIIFLISLLKYKRNLACNLIILSFLYSDTNQTLIIRRHLDLKKTQIWPRFFKRDFFSTEVFDPLRIFTALPDEWVEQLRVVHRAKSYRVVTKAPFSVIFTVLLEY